MFAFDNYKNKFKNPSYYFSLIKLAKTFKMFNIG